MKRLEDMDEQEMRDLMNATAHAIVRTVALAGVEKPLFVLVMFNDPKTGQYVSNCEREDVIKAMRETADRLEQREDVPR